MSKHQSIQTPRGEIIVLNYKNGSVSAKLTWNPGFGAQRTHEFDRVQRFVDKEVLRLCAPYIPFETGMLTRSGELGTVIGSGKVCYTAPYARRQYYTTAQSRPYDARRGARWFERMKIDHLVTLRAGAAKLAGGTAHG